MSKIIVDEIQDRATGKLQNALVSGANTLSAGPITIKSGNEVTVLDGPTWSIV